MMSKQAELTFSGWGLVGEPQEGVIVPTASGDGLDVTGYNAADYWDERGEFLGPDGYGVTPIYIATDGSQFPADARPYPYRA